MAKKWIVTLCANKIVEKARQETEAAFKETLQKPEVHRHKSFLVRLFNAIIVPIASHLPFFKQGTHKIDTEHTKYLKDLQNQVLGPNLLFNT